MSSYANDGGETLTIYKLTNFNYVKDIKKEDNSGQI